LAYALMRPDWVEVLSIFILDAHQLAIAQHQHVIQTLAAQTADEPLANRICQWGLI